MGHMWHTVLYDMRRNNVWSHMRVSLSMRNAIADNNSSVWHSSIDVHVHDGIQITL